MFGVETNGFSGAMTAIQVGDQVTFRLNSALPKAFKVPDHAIGRVVRKHLEPKSGQEWLDVDFGVGVGFVFAVTPDEFNIERPSLQAQAPSGDVGNPD
jgi:hypothetical protein